VISTLPIGDFSRATHLSVKTLRHYHEIGPLEPVDVDADTGYRRYATEQIVAAQIIRRFRDLDMPPQPMGRVSATVIPPAELATIVHPGPHAGIDRTYGALAAYVTRHALAVDGPIREYYLVGPSETRDESLWRTEVGWPIFETRPNRQ